MDVGSHYCASWGCEETLTWWRRGEKNVVDTFKRCRSYLKVSSASSQSSTEASMIPLADGWFWL